MCCSLEKRASFNLYSQQEPEMCFGFLIALPCCLLWYISWVPSLKTVDSCAKLQSNVSKKTSADNTSVAWCYATWWNAESFLNILWRGNGVTRCIFSNYIWDATLLRGNCSNPPSTKKGGWRRSFKIFPLIWQMLLGVPCLLSDQLCVVALHC